MVIPEKDLLKVSNPSLGVKLLVHPKARVQIAIYSNQPDKAFVQEIDGIGNIKKQTEFAGYLGFWNATSKFEEIIAENLGIKEVYGLEVGMVIELQQDTKKYKKGDIIGILAVDENGVATQTQRLNKQQISNVVNSPYVSKLRKGEDLSFLVQEGFKSISEIDAFKAYEFGLIKESELAIPLNLDYRGLKAQDKLNMVASKGGGEVEIQQLVFYTDANGKTVIAANVLFEDGSMGRVPLRDFLEKPVKKAAIPKAEETQDEPMGYGLKRPTKKTPYYIYNIDEKQFEIQPDARPVQLKYKGDYFLVKVPKALSKWEIYEGITGRIIGLGKTKEKAILYAENIMKLNPIIIETETLVNSANKNIGVSPRYK
jgi:hypothetical protein